MTNRIWHLIVGLLYLLLATFAVFADETFYWAVSLVLANMWIISANFKE